jgi:HAD superfamily hydrolase (TIGR01549 family)
MIQAIIFDFWGTLVQNGVWSPIKQVRNILQIRVPFSEYVVRMEKAMMTKEFASLREAFEEVCNEFKIKPENDIMEELIGMWNKSWMLAKPFEETIEVLKKLKNNYKLILISNTDSISINNVLEKFTMKEMFDSLFFSFEMNLIKTDDEFLEKVLEQEDLKVEDCILIGDSMKSDIKAAEKMKIKAVLIDRRNTRDYPLKISNLRELEKLL